jgi:hypothetical protein
LKVTVKACGDQEFLSGVISFGVRRNESCKLCDDVILCCDISSCGM